MSKQFFVSNIIRCTASLLSLVFFTLFLPVIEVVGQKQDHDLNQSQGSKPALSQRELLPDNLGGQWKAVSTMKNIHAGQISALPDADILSEYGLQRILTRVYTNGRSGTSVEIFEMNFISGAYGLFTFNRALLRSGNHEFYDGRYLVRILNDSPDASTDQTLITALKLNLIGEAGQFPILPSHLPEEHKIPESEKYIVGPRALGEMKNFSDLKEVIDFEGGVEAAIADYRNGNGQMSLIIIEYHTPQSAANAYTQVWNYFNGLPQQEKDRRLLKRTGNYIVGAVNVEEINDAQNIINQIKYEAKVYWAGRKLSDIPLEFRPLDPVAIEEAKRTVKVLLRSFYWIGAMLLSAILLGIIAGGLLFYWNRYRRRKLGLDDLFSDAGGTLRLNLDDYSFLPDETRIKQIGKGDDLR